MLNKKKQKHYGFTYVEILICLVIITLSVGPLSYTYLTSVRTSVSAVQLEKAAAYAKRLLQDIKEQITQDMIQQQKAFVGQIPSPSIDTRYGVIQYLRDYDELEIPMLTDGVTERQISLDKLLKDFSTEFYETSQYAYEIALWRLSDVDFSSGILTMDQDTLKKASRFYSDEEAKYQFLEENYSTDTNLINFQISGAILKAFQDNELKYIPYPTEQDKKVKLLDLCTVKVKDDGTVDSTINGKLSRVTLTSKGIKDANNQVVGYTITNRCHSVFTESDGIYRTIIDLDMRSFLENLDLSEVTEDNQVTFKVINETEYDQVIRVKQNTTNLEEIDRVNKKIHVSVVDRDLGKSTIIQADDILPYENYLIAIIVRDKSPVQGQAGKIVKKMLDVYSYDVSRH